MNQNKKVMVLVKSIDGGTGTFLFSFLRIKEYSPNVNVQALCLEKPSFRKIKKNNLKFLHSSNFYPQNYGISIKLLYLFLAEIIKVKKEIDRFSPKVVVGIDVHANILLLIIKLLYFKKFKLILTTHINLIETLGAKGSPILRLVIKWLVKSLYDRADKLIFISKDLGYSFRKTFKPAKNIEVINYGLRLSKKQKILKASHNKVISIGRLVEQKDFETLISAFSELIKMKKEANLTIVGDGPLRDSLEQLALKKNLDSHIAFPGWSNSVKNALSKADIYVFSSKREGFGYVLLEAMAAGLPIISTDAPFGPREILGNGKFGILVPVGDKEGIRRNLKELMENNKEYLKYSNLSLKRVQDFSEKKMLDKYTVLINDLYEG